MRHTSPNSGGTTSARVAWRCLCSLVLCVAGTSLVGRAVLAQDTPPPELAAWATEYPFQYSQWAKSAHGVAFLEGDANAPDCTGCHQDPTSGEQYTSAFRLEIPSRCSACHADPVKMKASGLATDVYDTYLADTHGRKIEFYRQTNPDAERFEAVCTDCHGSHTAYIVPPAEMTKNCQACHGNATERFNTASMGHFRMDRQAPLSMAVRIFYLILLPAVMGVMLGYIVLDLCHRARTRRKGTEA